MHDIKAIRENKQYYIDGWLRRGRKDSHEDVETLLYLDQELRNYQSAFQAVQGHRNSASKQIGEAKAQKDEERAQSLMGMVNSFKQALESNEQMQRHFAEALKGKLYDLPNLPADDVPSGADELSNIEQEDRRFGTPKILPFNAKDHSDLGESLKGPLGSMMDFQAAAKMSGARFVVLKGELARLERAIGQFMLDVQTTEHGYTEVNPPVMVRSDALYGTGQLPKFEDDLFKTISFNEGEMRGDLQEIFDIQAKSFKLRAEGDTKGADDLWNSARRNELNGKLNSTTSYFNDVRYLIPTAEVTLTNLVREAITAEEELPLRLTALTNCFRAEAGSAGRDTKGMIRQHQFQKVELVSITTPEQSDAEHDRMTTCAETILKKLDLSFRTMLLCTGDMGFGAKKTYDLEVWLPSQNTYREISSCSNCGDFQARRMDARTRKAGEKGTRFVHTLNGSGLAVGRTLVAIMENYQDEGGRIAIPSVLQPYMGGLTHIG